ncbi:hypothetical protein SODALDRAFT_314461 [Sodiomyces alkalinus F11]|uniref:C2 domain-containing protein n=1 Tax=Sodiomyces alkalinus (strain CBS 110278 / VKM F-3762 / F11) TaxID=1314773 RepID=A0A3N2PQT3_SODAK|nr:hypothetical protein SODALDRAFT_314461 [Sodiomyces alkalinus F11]ROT36838.1 hypothetical protein SODALDRAFT_314461 [Sodiomyces alkalinus F11]
MSSASTRSYLHRRLDSSRSTTRSRASSRAQQQTVSYDEAYSFALRIAYLNHLLQPPTKRKQWVPAPKPVERQNSSALIGQFASGSVRLPHGFRPDLEKKMKEVLQGTSPLPGYNDPAVKRSFALAFNSFTERAFQKSVDKDRKIEPYILMFYSSARKAAQSTAAHNGSAHDDSSKLLADRHIALFVRLVSHMLRENGADRDRPELMSRLGTLENKLLTNDQNLAAVTGQNGGIMIEVTVPISHDVKDMPMVLLVSRIFDRQPADAQADIDAHMSIWTEKAALQDLKAYQHRLNSAATGALRKQDFDLDEAFEAWKRSEAPHLSQILLDILTAKPELAKASSSSASASTGLDSKPLPGRPQSFYGDDQAYADLGRAIASGDYSSPTLDHSLSLSSLSLDDAPSTIRTVDDPTYTFIPPDPRAFYKSILSYCMDHDHRNSDPELPYAPLSKHTVEFLVELCVYWRVPQFSRLVAFLEVASRRFLDHRIGVDELAICLDFVKSAGTEFKKPPHIEQYAVGLTGIDRSLWTLHDYAAHQHTLQLLHDALLRDLYDQLQGCYGQSPPNIGMVMHLLENHVQNDPGFSPRSGQMEDFATQVSERLRRSAQELYTAIVEAKLPDDAAAWQFCHVVEMGKLVVSRITKIQKRYRNAPEIMGVRPLAILVESTLPLFEKDAEHIIAKSIETAQTNGEEIDIQDGFDLYRELVTLRGHHRQYLPNQPFAFDVEALLEGFVWRWIKTTEGRMQEFVENAIKQDNFGVRPSNADQPPLDAERHSVSIVDLFMLFRQTAAQIEDLHWENEYHHARFMTRLAHSFAVGIEKYCELVSKIFAADMDRPSPEELATASRTAQEKFLKYAKDAWNSKEKPTPYNFNSQVFVMLNNIEYAKQELDKLERSINVDMCAEIIRQVEGPKAQPRKPNKYNFTVKVVEAEDLKVCDTNGFSDPYVVLVDECQNRLHKTRVIRKNLNPRWDETIDITVTAPITILATIWDDDMFGDHDYVGRTSFKLDPLHFSDYIPREVWLDLDSQGRLLVKISMEGERDDIEFQFGKAFRDLKRTEQSMVRKITDKLRDQINATISLETLRNLLKSGGIGASVTSLWKKRASTMPVVLTRQDIEDSLGPLCDYFFDNFSVMSQTLTKDTMRSVMLRLWKEVLLAVEGLLVPPLSDKPSEQRQLSQKEMDTVYIWLDTLFKFFNAKDETGAELGVLQNDLKSPKWHELATLNFFYFEDTNNLIRESERIAAATAQRAQQALMQHSRLSAPVSLGPAPTTGAAAFGSMGTIRRGKSIMMSRNLGTMRRAKEEKRKEAQADPNDDMILRILRMRPEATWYLKDRSRQKERQSAATAAAMIVRNSVHQGWATGSAASARSSPRR